MRGYEVLAVGATAGCLLSHCWDKHCPIGAPRAAAVQEEHSWMCRGSWPDLLDCKANSSDLGIPRGVVDVKSQHISFFFFSPLCHFSAYNVVLCRCESSQATECTANGMLNI